MSSLHPQPKSSDRFLDAGVVILAIEREQYAISIELIAFVGATVTDATRGSVFRSENAASLRFAYYSNATLRNGWQPCDQPHPSAYLPMRFTSLDRIDANGGAFFVQRHSVCQRIWREVIDEAPRRTAMFATSWDEAAVRIDEVLLRNGLSERDRELLLRNVHDRLPSSSALMN